MSPTEHPSLTRRALLRLGALGTMGLMFLPELARGGRCARPVGRRG